MTIDDLDPKLVTTLRGMISKHGAPAVIAMFEMHARIARMMAPPGGRPMRHVCDSRADPDWHAHTLLLKFR